MTRERQFILRLAHEFRRADWRRLLSEISASELGDWLRYFGETPFSPQLLDMEFAGLNYTLVQMLGETSTVTMPDFSLLQRDAPAVEMDDEMLMAAGEGIAGGVRYEPANRGSGG
ncbi:phage tail assembly protein T [Xenorhabdus thuongxuanensis]|uniref:Minor tail T domain-containing protein n=1 Tax=Xenorhabdus thuongxuanensis TaxID=1873484 RepID=A0A1Q5U3R5_9GAMM|nr:phage tail assembly protein T [Xenorhabdus thuongxuanensis]OKP07118.1 hypothetical protein Xentx_01722 [Xenorhabdus thuongxuanensis]